MTTLPVHLDDALTDNLDRLEKLVSDARWLVKEHRLRLSSGADLAPWQALAERHLKGKEGDMSATAEAVERAFRMLCPTLAPAA